MQVLIYFLDSKEILRFLDSNLLVYSNLILILQLPHLNNFKDNFLKSFQMSSILKLATSL